MPPKKQPAKLSNQPPCSVCGKVAEKDCIHCDFCTKWIHNSCSGLTPDQIDIIGSCDALAFSCPSCKGPSGVATILQSIQSQLAAVIKENEQMRKENSALTARVVELEKKSADVGFEITYSAIAEYFDRDRKKNNMVMHYLPNDTGDKESDKKAVVDLVNSVSGDSAAIVDVFRMGNIRGDGKPRPTKVICNNAWTKRSLIMGQGKLLTGFPELKKIGFFIRDDLTVVQREADKKMRVELADLRVKFSEKKLIIRDGTIVERNPTGWGVIPFHP